MRVHNTAGVALATGILMAAGAAQADIVAQYDSGVAAAAGAAGAADPTSQGWTNSETGSNSWAHAYDSGDGGWRTVDGTNRTNVFYQHDFSASAASKMAVEWHASVTFSMDSDAINGTGGFVDDYYLPPNSTRQQDMTIWLENAATGYLYILKLQIDEFADLYLFDGITSHKLTTDGSAYDNFKTIAIDYVGGVATLNFGTLSYTLADTGGGALDRAVFGASSTPEQGSAIWNSFSVDAVPAPAGLSLLALGGLIATRRRR